VCGTVCCGFVVVGVCCFWDSLKRVWWSECVPCVGVCFCVVCVRCVCVVCVCVCVCVWKRVTVCW